MLMPLLFLIFHNPFFPIFTVTFPSTFFKYSFICLLPSFTHTLSSITAYACDTYTTLLSLVPASFFLFISTFPFILYTPPTASSATSLRRPLLIPSPSLPSLPPSTTTFKSTTASIQPFPLPLLQLLLPLRQFLSYLSRLPPARVHHLHHYISFSSLPYSCLSFYLHRCTYPC